MSDVKEVLKINDDFYQAFRNADIHAMETLWSSKHDVAVIHPSWPAIHGRESVLSSWRQIIEAGNTPDIQCIDAKASLLGNFAFVICTETLNQGQLVATNIFVLEENRWRIVHHQAGPLPELTTPNENQSIH